MCSSIIFGKSYASMRWAVFLPVVVQYYSTCSCASLYLPSCDPLAISLSHIHLSIFYPFPVLVSILSVDLITLWAFEIKMCGCIIGRNIQEYVTGLVPRQQSLTFHCVYLHPTIFCCLYSMGSHSSSPSATSYYSKSRWQSLWVL
jgi:hypothetical protein